MPKFDRENYEYVTRYLESYLSPEKHIEQVRKLTEDLESVNVECDIEGDYGGDRAVMYVTGYRKLNLAEKRQKQIELARERDEAERREREVFERLKKKFSDD